MSTPRSLNGLHADNARFSDRPGGATEFWQLCMAARVSKVKLLWHPTNPEQTRADAWRARELSIEVLVRAPGEGLVHSFDLGRLIDEFAGLCRVVEVGNEPNMGTIWPHLWFLENNWRLMSAKAHAAGMALCTPGWTGQAEPPTEPPDDRPWEMWPADSPHRLNARIYGVYREFDAVAVHAYGLHNFAGHVERINRWAAAFPGKPLYVTEAGIAARDLIPPGSPSNPAHWEPSLEIKAKRYAEFLSLVAANCPAVVGVYWFIAGGTEHWRAFNEAGYFDKHGRYSYHMPLEAWRTLGNYLAT